MMVKLNINDVPWALSMMFSVVALVPVLMSALEVALAPVLALV